jgi:hypothetical protein
VLKHFAINNTRDILVPDFECYQMDLGAPVQQAIDAGEVSDDFRELPSWTKFASHPVKSKGFFVRVVRNLFLGEGNDELNVDLQTEAYLDKANRGKRRVAMMFMPAGTRNECLEMVADIAQEALDGFEVVALFGEGRHNGQKITNRVAQRVATEVLESTDKSVLFIASQMAQRSFSVPEITELYLAYDRGDNGATLQKMSRTLTPGEEGKVGRIFSLAFDPNLDDKFDAMVIETAVNYKKRHDVKSLREALSTVLSTIDIFKCAPEGSIKVSHDTYLADAMERKAISRVIGKVININALPHDAVIALAEGNSDVIQSLRLNAVASGKTRESQKSDKQKAPKKVDTDAKTLAKAREVVVTILENLDYIILGTDNTLLSEAIQQVLMNPEYTESVYERFGVDPDVIAYLFENDIIRQDWAELMFDISA